MICRKCNTQNQDGMRFCRHCGAPLEPAAPMPPQNGQQGYRVQGGQGYGDNFVNNNRSTPPVGSAQTRTNVGQSYPAPPQPPQPPQKKSGNMALIIALISVVVLLLIAGVFVVLIVTGVIGGKGGEPVTEPTTAQVQTVPEEPTTDSNLTVIPNVVGMKSANAYSVLAEAKLSHETKFEYSDTVPEDYVISQSPAGNSPTDIGDTVTVVISRGVKATQPPTTARPSSSSSSRASSSSSRTTSGTSDDRYGLHASTRLITRSDISWMDKDEIQFAINEIYAKHGYIFPKGEYRTYFNSQDWYHGDTDDVYVVADRMNYYEKENLKVMGNYRDEFD